MYQLHLREIVGGEAVLAGSFARWNSGSFLLLFAISYEPTSYRRVRARRSSENCSHDSSKIRVLSFLFSEFRGNDRLDSTIKLTREIGKLEKDFTEYPVQKPSYSRKNTNRIEMEKRRRPRFTLQQFRRVNSARVFFQNFTPRELGTK